jgi:hypothetical protein
MPSLNEFQSAYGTILATFPVNGTYSAAIETRGMGIAGMYVVGAFGSNAGSATFRASADPSGTGFPVYSEASVLYRINPFATGTYYQITAGSAIRAPYLRLEVGTGGTAGHAAGGTVVLVGVP